jgi:iron(III) transport system ATP-binding protein
MSVNVNINNVTKKYGNFTAVTEFSLKIKKGEFFTLLGPSGCGKTTLLRMIAGFNSIEDGEILFDDLDISKIPAHKRDIGMVFQNHALFPHLSIYKNVEYGLNARKVSADKRKERVLRALELVQIEHLKDKMPYELSGGQQQRVALARAIVIEPKILLMDEPLSNLDAKLRIQMRSIIKKLQTKLGITTIYVTHDQEEALAISDRIAVMDKGKIKQIGKPEQIYRYPENKFVSNFIGTSNLLDGTYSNGKIKILDYSFSKKLKIKDNSGVLVSIRPEQFTFSNNDGIKGEIILSTFLGDFINYEIQLENNQIIEVNQYSTNDIDIKKGKVNIKILTDNIIVFNLNGESRIK